MGTLATVRDRFLNDSGRFDLGTVGGEDNGANLIINSAQRHLDRLQETPLSTRRFQTDYSAGEGNFEIQDLIAPKSVHVANDLGTVKLYFKEYEYLFEVYDESDTTNGAPLYYGIAVSGLAPQIQDLNHSTYEEQFTRKYGDLKFGNFWKTKVLLIRPRPDQEGTLILTGRFYSPLLQDDHDRSYWTEEAEQALLFASLFFLESSMRNESAAQYWYSLLRTELNTVDNEMVWLDTYNKPIRRLG